MKTVLDKSTRHELVARINTLGENSTAQWGKMNINQMLKHCTDAEEMFLEKVKFKRSFIGVLFGKMALKGFLKDESPMNKNMPTLAEIKMKEPVNSDVMADKKKWIALIEDYENFSSPEFMHPFFGRMTKEQMGRLVYKHIDHHLRQFNS